MTEIQPGFETQFGRAMRYHRQSKTIRGRFGVLVAIANILTALAVYLMFTKDGALFALGVFLCVTGLIAAVSLNKAYRRTLKRLKNDIWTER